MATPGRLLLRSRPRGLLLLLPGLLLPLAGAFNLDVESPAEYAGPEGSYFGFAVDFFAPSTSSRMFLLVGAPKANTTQPGIVEGGQVLKCDCSSSRRCQPIEFDSTGNRDFAKDDPLEFKSHQWLGASVRSKQDKILACAPLYHWRTEMKQEREPVGTCFLQDGTKTVEYAPCRSKNIDADGQGFCQGGFSIDFTKADRVLLGGPGSFYWQGQLISDQVAEIISKYDPNVYSIKYNNQLATRAAQAIFDDSYLGYSVAVGDFNGDGIEDFVSGVPRAARTLGMVYIYDGKNMSSLHNFTGEQMAAYFGFSVAATDINGDDYADVFIGAPLFMDRGSDGKLQEVGQVSVSLQRASGDFQTTKLNGFEVFARFGSAIAPLGDLDQDGFNDIAIAAPYGGEDKKGLVYIFNGRSTGLNSVPSQILEGQWAAQSMPPSFGYSMKGATDVDGNGYPDFQVELLLDKLKQKGAIRRALFLHNRSPGHSKNMTVFKGGQMQCEELVAYLRDESEFRDKLTPITVFMEYRLDHRTAADDTGLQPILNQFTPANVSRQPDPEKTSLDFLLFIVLTVFSLLDDSSRGFYDSSRGFYDRSRGFYDDSSRGFYDSSRGFYDSGRGFYDSSRGFYDDSSRGFYDSSRGFYDSSRGFYDYSSRGFYDYSSRGFYDDSSRGFCDRSRGLYDSSRGFYDSSRGFYDDSSRGFCDRSRGLYDSSRGFYDSSRGFYDDSSRGFYDSSRGHCLTEEFLQGRLLIPGHADNVCKPKLEVSVDSDQKKIYIGDDNPLTLTVKAQNQGEGAYEAELIVSIPPQADFIGVVRNNEALARLSCAFKTENQTRQVVCDLGNPMKAGTQLFAGLRFSVHQQSEMDTSVKFDLKIQSSNSFDNVSPVVSYKVDLAVLAAVEIRGVSSPDHVFLPIPNWEYKENPETEEDVGPIVQHVYESVQTSEKNDTAAGQERGHLITKRDLTVSEGDVHTL
ncbi:hypothetical protein STEG23_034276, partial [Scotinomys teguina]